MKNKFISGLKSVIIVYLLIYIALMLQAIVYSLYVYLSHTKVDSGWDGMLLILTLTYAIVALTMGLLYFVLFKWLANGIFLSKIHLFSLIALTWFLWWGISETNFWNIIKSASIGISQFIDNYNSYFIVVYYIVILSITAILTGKLNDVTKKDIL